MCLWCNLVHAVCVDKDVPFDCSKNYLRCQFLWGMIADITGEVYGDVCSRLGVGRTSGVLGIIVGHHIYHHMRFSNGSAILNMRGRKQWPAQLDSGHKYGLAAY